MSENNINHSSFLVNFIGSKLRKYILFFKRKEVKKYEIR